MLNLQVVPFKVFSAEEVEREKKLLNAIDNLEIGIVQYNFLLPHDGERNGPRFSTRKYNPRETTKESLKDVREQFQHASGGLVKDRPEYAIFMAVRPSWINNLQEIKGYQKEGRQGLPRIEWKSGVKEEVAELMNGNHRFHLLRAECAEQMAQLDDIKKREKDISDDIAEGVEITRSRRKQQKTDIELKVQVKDIMKREGLFSVKLFDLGE